MPSVHQKWAHSTVSKQLLEDALLDTCVTAIEVDIVIGYKREEKDSIDRERMKVITAHPPDQYSDQTIEEFLMKTSSSKANNRILKKHIKLDFKELATIQPTMNIIDKIGICSDENNMKVFLNADVLPGPAKRFEEPTINCDDFFNACLHNRDPKNMIFSLGWSTDPRSYGGYTENDIDNMIALTKKYNVLSNSLGVVYAVNARVLIKDCHPFLKLLSTLKSSQVLVWTATGEPPIPKHKIQYIQLYFEKEGFGNRVGFDCKVESSYLMGLMYDFAVFLSSIYFYCKNYHRKRVKIL